MTQVKFLDHIEGVNSSTANHLANIAKEIVKGKTIVSMPIKTQYFIVDGAEKRADNNKSRPDWDKDLLAVGKLNSLIAWLREGLKYKEKLVKQVEDSEDYLVVEGVKELKPLMKKPDTTFETYLSQLNIADRCAYFSNEAVASSVGAFVHNFDRFREAFSEHTPYTFAKTHASEVLVKSELLYDEEDFMSKFFELQAKHREAEQAVNSFKAKHKAWEKQVLDAVSDKNREITNENASIQNENLRLKAERREIFEQEKRAEIQRIASLKIVIPNELKSTYEEVKQKGGKVLTE